MFHVAFISSVIFSLTCIRDVCRLLIEFKDHPHARYFESNITASCHAARKIYQLTAQCYFVIWVLLGNVIIYHQNLTLWLHCIHFAATSKFCSICRCVREALLSHSRPSLTQYDLMFLIVFGTEKYFDGIRCHQTYQSSNLGKWMRYLGISYLVIS